MTALGDALLRAIAIGLGLDADWFARHVTADPTVLFRIFRYPPAVDDGWGVGEHTDYGLLTILATDANGGLQVHGTGRVDRRAVDPGRLRRQPRRHARPDDRGPVPLDAAPGPQHERRRAPVVPVLHRPVVGCGVPGAAARRHARRPTTPLGAGTARSVRAWEGTYGEYLTAKVAKVFPDLFRRRQLASLELALADHRRHGEAEALLDAVGQVLVQPPARCPAAASTG